ncbi:MAG TPA: cyclic nucleotide-binding domain-containing protein [Nitrospirae bacterium]|nr:cyclic nucleotide-binding domain-containing protein [Nitrospirota bacterium]HDO22626.1 cyclic nucleotide-binding domain-containing protein [Nitrospirota bacterium]HDZ87059.1 cyclic nucleotide-binding domain-containing protein [Nitrospirota bacterium]
MMESRTIWRKFHKALKNNNWAAALTVIDQIIEAEPGNPNHYLKKGDICRRQGNSAEAVNAYLKAASFLNKQGFLKKALAVCKMVMRVDPDNREALETSSSILIELEAPKQAAPELKKAGTETEKLSMPQSGEPEASQSIESAEYKKSTEQTPHETEQIITKESGGDIPTEGYDMKGIIEPTSYQESAGDGTWPAESFAEPTPPDVEGPSEESEFMPQFTDNEIRDILSRSEVRKFSAGETLVQEGDTGDSVFIIKTGTVSVVAHILGKEINLATLSEGNLFGEVAYLTGRPRTASVIAKSDTEVYEVNRLLLDEIIEQRPEIMSQINEIFNTRIKHTIDKVKNK